MGDKIGKNWEILGASPVSGALHVIAQFSCPFCLSFPVFTAVAIFLLSRGIVCHVFCRHQYPYSLDNAEEALGINCNNCE